MKTTTYLLILASSLLICCKPFLDIDPPKTSLVQESAFRDNETATTAMLGIYSSMAGANYAGGGNTSISVLVGLSADEFNSYSATLQDFYEAKLSPANATLRSLYATPYQHIFAANAVLEGLATAPKISPPVKAQLQGEAHFIRGFIYFYLVNLFGAVPLQLQTDYRVTRLTPLSSPDRVYAQIILDLKAAENLLTDTYISTERVRPNLSAVQALLARIYLYQKEWTNADKYASLVIAKTGNYSLPAPDNAFLKDSPEAIWQLFPTAGANTREGNLFILTATPVNVALTQNFLLSSFEPEDKRKTAWVKSYTNTTGTYYYPFKYKIKSSAALSEYSMVLRLAEQYLIRAEARTQLNTLAGAISDLDQIRERAGLPLLKNTHPGMSQTELLSAILKERNAELFSEWGHRWLDLKRSGHAGAILIPLKPGWKESNLIYPLPSDETARNPNL